MVKSPFIIESEYNETHRLLYCTSSARFVLIEKAKYDSVFNNINRNQYLKAKDVLQRLGFLVENADKEFEKQREIRIKTYQEENKKPTTDYVITPTMNCNARCYYCFERGVHHVDMSVETAQLIVNFICKNADNNPITIHWFGGEPLLRQDIIDYITKGLKTNNVKFLSRMTTNGYLMDETVIKHAVKEWNLCLVHITIDGIGEEYDKVKSYINHSPKTSAFDRVIGHIQTLLDYDLKVRLRINYNPMEAHHVSEIIDYLLDRFHYNANMAIQPKPIFSDSKAIPPITNKYNAKEKHPLIEAQEYEEKCKERLKEDETHYRAEFKPFCHYKQRIGKEDVYSKILNKYSLLPKNINCLGVCNSTCAIDSIGNIFTCHLLLGQTKEYASGNVVNGIVDNENQKYYNNYELTEKKCMNCRLLPLCQGGCKYKHKWYKSNQGCLGIYGTAEETIVLAAKELQENGYSIQTI